MKSRVGAATTRPDAIVQIITKRGDGETMDEYLKKAGPEMAAVNLRLTQAGLPELAASMQTKPKKTKAYIAAFSKPSQTTLLKGSCHGAT